MDHIPTWDDGNFPLKGGCIMRIYENDMSPFPKTILAVLFGSGEERPWKVSQPPGGWNKSLPNLGIILETLAISEDLLGCQFSFSSIPKEK